MNWGVAFSLGRAAFCLAIEIEDAKMSTDKEVGEKKKEILGFPFRLLGLVHWGRGGSEVLSTFCPRFCPLTGTSYPHDFALAVSFVSNAFFSTMCSWNFADFC